MCQSFEQHCAGEAALLWGCTLSPPAAAVSLGRMGDSRTTGGSGGRAAAVCALNSGQISSEEEAGKAGRWLHDQPWEHWWITRFISLPCRKGYTGSSEQNDALFAGTLLSSPSSLPEQNSNVSVAGKVAKNSDFSSKLIAAHSGAGVGWSFVQPRAAGSTYCARKQKGRRCCCGLGAGCRKRRISRVWQYTGSLIFRCTTRKFSFVLTWCLIKEGLGWVYASTILSFMAGWKLEIRTLFL